VVIAAELRSMRIVTWTMGVNLTCSAVGMG